MRREGRGLPFHTMRTVSFTQEAEYDNARVATMDDADKKWLRDAIEASLKKGPSLMTRAGVDAAIALKRAEKGLMQIDDGAKKLYEMAASKEEELTGKLTAAKVLSDARSVELHQRETAFRTKLQKICGELHARFSAYMQTLKVGNAIPPSYLLFRTYRNTHSHTHIRLPPRRSDQGLRLPRAQQRRPGQVGPQPPSLLP